MIHRHPSLVAVGLVVAVCRTASAEHQGLTDPRTLTLASTRIAPEGTSWQGADRPQEKESPRRRDEDEAPARIGLLAGVGAPSLLNVGIAARVGRYVGVGADLGFIPEVTLSLYGEARLSYQQYDAYLRLFPAGGGFFVGSGVGYMTVKASMTRSIDIPEIAGVVAAQQVELGQSGSVRSMVLTPKIGYQASLGAGLVLAFEAGAQVPISSSEVELSTSVPAAYAAYASQYTPQAEAKVRESLRKVGQQPVPTMALRLGWMF